MKTNKTIFLFTIFLLIAFLFTSCGMLPQATKGVIRGRVLIPPAELSKDVSGWVPAANATVTIVDANGVTHTTTTDENGYYTFENISVKANTVVTTTVTVDGKTIVLKDVIPQAVAEDEDYDTGTMDPESTALALVVEKLLEEGVAPEEIDLEEIEASETFTELVAEVTEVLEEQGDVTADPEVLDTVDEIINPPAPPAPPSPPAPDTTPPRLVSLTAYVGEDERVANAANDWTLNWTVGEEVTEIIATASEPVTLAVDPAQAVVRMSGGSIPAGTVYGTIAVDPSDAKKLIITPNSGNETAALAGTFTFTVAAGVIEDLAGNPNAAVTITLEVVADTTIPQLESVSPAEAEIVLEDDETFVLTVDAKDDIGLYELEIDHSMEGILPEFSVYTDEDNPYGTEADKAEFESYGVTVTYDATEQKWTIDIGGDALDAIIANGGITFYLVIKDLSGNQWGTMYGTTPENTFAYTVKRKVEFTFTTTGIKNVIESLHNSTYQWGLWAVRIRPVIEGGSYEVIDASTTQEGWGAEAPSSNSWSVYGINCAWFYDISGAEVAGTPANPLYMIMDVLANTFWSGGYNAAGQWVADWAPGPDGLLGGGDDLGTFYSPGYDDGAGGTNVITAVSDSATFTFSFTYTGTWNGQCEFFVDGSKYELGTDTAPKAFKGNFWGGHGSWSADGSVDASGGLSGNTGTGYTIGVVPE